MRCVVNNAFRSTWMSFVFVQMGFGVLPSSLMSLLACHFSFFCLPLPHKENRDSKCCLLPRGCATRLLDIFSKPCTVRELSPGSKSKRPLTQHNGVLCQVIFAKRQDDMIHDWAWRRPRVTVLVLSRVARFYTCSVCKSEQLQF